jgi:serine/threonine protein kinase HipA of HipAB toxin-antitoxin module
MYKKSVALESMDLLDLIKGFNDRIHSLEEKLLDAARDRELLLREIHANME